MITQLRGTLIEAHPSQLIIDCGGVGYLAQTTLNTYELAQSSLEKEFKVYCHQIFREDAQLLFGFHSKEERNFFVKLISVNGVGPSSALIMLSTFQADELKNAIFSQNVKLLQSAKGIGAKTAQRIILDLKDKIEWDEDSSVKNPTTKNKTKTEALSALEVLGFSPKQTDKILEKILLEAPDSELEDLVKTALKML